MAAKGRSRRTKQAEVARRAGVSVSTVSKVVNDAPGISPELRRRVQQAAESLGYLAQAAAAKSRERRKQVTLVTYYQFVARDPASFYADILDGLMAEAEGAGLNLSTLLIDRADGAERISQMLKDRPDGIIMMGADEEHLLAPLRGANCPVVILTGQDRQMQFDSVSPAFRAGGYLATKRLLDLGHRKIVHVTHLYRRTIRSRLEGFRDALEEAGIAYDPAVHLIDAGDVMFEPHEAERAVLKRWELGGIDATAFFCAADVTAIGVMQALRRMDLRVPQDVSIVAFDDLPIAQLCSPPLTTVTLDRTEIGRAGIRCLVQRWKDPMAPSRRIELGVRIVVRLSDQPWKAPGSA